MSQFNPELENRQIEGQGSLSPPMAGATGDGTMGNVEGVHPPAPTRLLSHESAASSYADCLSDLSSDDEDCADYDQYQDDEDVNDGGCSMNPVLEKDIENCRLLHGDRSIQYRLFPSIDDIDVELHIPLSFFEEEVAKAWRVTTSEPLVIRLHLSETMYLDSTNAPKLEVFQPSRQAKCGVASQMRVIMETFVSRQWKSVTNEAVKSKYTSVLPATRTKHSATMSQIAENSCAAGTAEATFVDDATLASLVDMGFSTVTARNALIINRGDVDAAADMLLSSTHRCSENSTFVFDGEPRKPVKPAGEEPLAVPAVKPPPLSPYAALSAPAHKPPPKGLNGFKTKFRKKPNTMVSSITAPDLLAAASTVDSVSSDLSLRRENVKVFPGFEHGFLVQVFEYARQRIPTLNEFCVVCDEQHVFKNGAMLKPAVCARELCVFAYQTLGVMADAAEAIGTGPEVVDLLIEMARAACLSQRKNLIFDPYPTVVDPSNPNELALNPKNKDFNRVEKALRGILPMDVLEKIEPADLKKQMDLNNTLSYQLLQWIITSNRSHIVKLPASRQLSFMNTDHQFLLLSSPPAKEARFRAEKHKYGSTFAFHGSHLENWHSILRNGLMNASGTKFQMNGAAYGKGIYLSPKACVSFGYSGLYGVQRVITSRPQSKQTSGSQAPKRSRFLKGKTINCIALCEVITSKELKKSGDIWVCPNSNHVCTRFFFLYDDGQVGNANVDTQSAQVKEEVLQSCGYQASYM